MKLIKKIKSKTSASTVEEFAFADPRIDFKTYGTVYCPGLSGNSTSTDQILLTKTFANGGWYWLQASIPLNYYGQEGRFLLVKLYVNST